MADPVNQNAVLFVYWLSVPSERHDTDIVTAFGLFFCKGGS
jgi:hypothetical protein